MNEYKFINSESLAKSITDLLKAEMGKIHFPPEFVECELKDEWLQSYVDGLLQDADDTMDGMLIEEYAISMGLVSDYNKHIFGVDNNNGDDAQFKDLVKRIREEDHHAQTKSDLEFLNTWYLENFAKDNIVNPFVKKVKKWAYDWA